MADAPDVTAPIQAQVIGLGASGSHCARQLATTLNGRPGSSLHLVDTDVERQARVVDATGQCATALPIELASPMDRASAPSSTVTVLATPVGTHVELAESLLRRGSHVVSMSDGTADVEGLLALDTLARDHDRSLVVGAGFAPGVTDLLARLAAMRLDVVDEISVAKAGTGGPACARQHHRALKTPGRVFIDGAWVVRPGGSGRDLAWFPGSIGARDAYRGDLPGPLLLHRAFPDATRISARVSATRRDRFTSRLPMLRPPHADGGPGAVRVELRGRRDGAVQTIVFGVMDHPSVASGTTAAVLALAAVGSIDSAERLPVGAFGLSELPDPRPHLRDLRRRGVKAATFEGTGVEI